MRPGDFADQLGHLKDGGFTPLTFADLAATLRDGGSALPERPVVITFDDGYADFHTEALPILDRYDFAATVFVTSGWLDDAGPHAAGRPLDRMLTWSQTKEAAAHGVEVAGHSHSHPQLDQIGDAALREELSRNKALLEDEIGRPVTTMAYPYGYSNARVRRAVGGGRLRGGVRGEQRARGQPARPVRHAPADRGPRHHPGQVPGGRRGTRGAGRCMCGSGRSPRGTPWSAGRGGRYARPCQVCGGSPAARSSPRFAGRQAAGSA